MPRYISVTFQKLDHKGIRYQTARYWLNPSPDDLAASIWTGSYEPVAADGRCSTPDILAGLQDLMDDNPLFISADVEIQTAKDTTRRVTLHRQDMRAF